jgi:hypothetical protein
MSTGSAAARTSPLRPFSSSTTALTSMQPMATVFSIAFRSAPSPWVRPNSNRSIMARIPSCLPRRFFNSSHSRSKLAGHFPWALHWSNAVDP